MRKVKIFSNLGFIRQCSVCRDVCIDFDCFLEEHDFDYYGVQEAKRMFLDPNAQIICMESCELLFNRVLNGEYGFKLDDFDQYIKSESKENTRHQRRQFWWLLDLGLISMEVKKDE